MATKPPPCCRCGGELGSTAAGGGVKLRTGRLCAACNAELQAGACAGCGKAAAPEALTPFQGAQWHPACLAVFAPAAGREASTTTDTVLLPSLSGSVSSGIANLHGGAAATPFGGMFITEASPAQRQDARERADMAAAVQASLSGRSCSSSSRRRGGAASGSAAAPAAPALADGPSDALRVLAGNTVAELYDVVALAQEQGVGRFSLGSAGAAAAAVGAAAAALASAAPAFSRPFQTVAGGTSLENIVRRLKAAGLFRDRVLRSKTYKDALPGHELLDFLVANRIVASSSASGGSSARAEALGVARVLVVERHLLPATSGGESSSSSTGGGPSSVTFDEAGLYVARPRDETGAARGTASAASLDLLASGAASFAALAGPEGGGATGITPFSSGSGGSSSSGLMLPRNGSESALGSGGSPAPLPGPLSAAATAAPVAASPSAGTRPTAGAVQDWDSSSGGSATPSAAAASAPPPVPPPRTIPSLSRVMVAAAAGPTDASGAAAAAAAGGSSGSSSRGPSGAGGPSTPTGAGGGPVQWGALTALLRSVSASAGARLSGSAGAATVTAKLDELRAMQAAIQARLAAADGARLLQGWLLKRGKNGRNWNRRWFCLQGHTLAYYKKVPPVLLGADKGAGAAAPALSTSAGGGGLLSALSSLVGSGGNAPSGVLDVRLFSLEEALGITKSPLSMRLVSRKVAQQEVALCAESEADFEAWVKALTRLMTDHEEAGRALAEIEDASLRLRGVMVRQL